MAVGEEAEDWDRRPRVDTLIGLCVPRKPCWEEGRPPRAPGGTRVSGEEPALYPWSWETMQFKPVSLVLVTVP